MTKLLHVQKSKTLMKTDIVVEVQC